VLIVSDTSPLHLLIQVAQIDILPALFGQVAVPPEVAREMAHPNAPDCVRAFIAAPPAWLSIQAPTGLLAISSLDPGETAAISLAVELGAPLLIDEKDGRKAAQAHGVTVVGAVGVLERAADLALVPDLAAVHAAIRSLPFRVADVVLDASLARHRSRMGNTKEHP
jgi:predicted nucleic acid-binding protein